MRVLLVINARDSVGVARASAAGTAPRKDYLELQRALAADLLDLDALEARRWTRLVRRLAGAAVAQALLAWAWSARYEAIFVDRESAGLLLAALLARRRRPPRLVLIGHLISGRAKRLFCRLCRPQRGITTLVVHASRQRDLAVRGLGLRAEQLALVPYGVDDRFWHPMPGLPGRRICSAGLEYRDYPTLLDALAGLDLETTIAAASHWSRHPAFGSEEALPPGVRVAAYDYPELRDLYARSRFVVVPLLQGENQAGITTILEAMAMGKAVIVSRARGQTDTVYDPRQRGSAALPPPWAETGPNGIYVPPGDPRALRRAIQHLLDRPEEAEGLGANGRRLVEGVLGLDRFTARMVALIAGEPSTGG